MQTQSFAWIIDEDILRNSAIFHTLTLTFFLSLNPGHNSADLEVERRTEHEQALQVQGNRAGHYTEAVSSHDGETRFRQNRRGMQIPI